ncbi:MAG: hypothetical protein AAFR64_00700 [Pseudomonadota bacterium]
MAAAIPIVAGGALVRSSTDGQDAGTVSVETAKTDTENGTKVAVTEGETVTAPKPAESEIAESPADTPSMVVEPAEEAMTEATTETGASLAELPQPDAPSPSDPDLFNEFLQYAMSKATIPVDDAQANPTLSAVLRDPVALDGQRAVCDSSKRSVVVDLDSGDTAFSPGMKLKADANFMLGLGELRGAGITVAWVSSAPAAYAGDLRIALRSSGLDALGRDPLLLMRYPDDRKQTRRNEFAGETCLIAIAGDERSDFDERYKYLKDPQDARNLDVLIENGWFLVPSQIASEAASNTGAPE